MEPTKKHLLLVKIIPSDSILLINVLLKNSDRILACTLSPPNLVTDDYQQFDRLFANDDSLNSLVKEIRKEILDKIDEQPKSTPANEQQQPQRRDNPLLINEPTMPQVYPAVPTYRPVPVPFPQVGGADLDPLGRGIGGGMLMDPRSLEENFVNPLRVGQPRDPRGLRFDPSSGLDRPLPPGAVPPGARFEYFGPPQRAPNAPRQPRRPQNHPDLEHFNSDYDNMFM